MQIPPDLLRTIFYIGRTVTTKGGEKEQLLGTGFFVAVPDETPPHRWTYMVTAKHVLIGAKDDYWVRFNLKDGAARQVTGKDFRWRDHPEYDATEKKNMVDVAVCKVPYDVESNAFMLEPSNFVGDLAEKGVSIGDEAFVIGSFTRLSGKTRNTPIARTGNLAMLPEDTVPTKEMGHIHAYLLEVRSFGGMSGAPVFIRETVKVDRLVGRGPGGEAYMTSLSGPGRIWLLGLMHGHWNTTLEQISDIAVYDPQEAPLNLGIAIVIPAYQIEETLMQPACLAEREKAHDELMARLAAEGPPAATDSSTA